MPDLGQVLAYHEATKHHFNHFARGPGGLDWATQPDPFRRYQGAPVLRLTRVEPGAGPPYEAAFWPGQVETRRLDLTSISQLFLDSLALSAWKRAGEVSWALRVNPSSGNLHPTEGYLICGPVAGLTGTPMVAHYAPREHALEVRAEFALEIWQALTNDLPEDAILIGLSSIHWREAWKYGERAFRYCQHDVGHAMAAISLAAAGLGWQVTLLDGLGSEQLSQLMGISEPQGVEAEHPDCLLAVYPQDPSFADRGLPEQVLAEFVDLPWKGKPNLLSPGHREWPAIDRAAVATEKPPTQGIYDQTATPQSPDVPNASESSTPLSLRQIVRQRRSAVAMDPHATLRRDLFYQILCKMQAARGQFPFSTLPWNPLVHLAILLHRVEDLEPGLYFLIRQPGMEKALRSAMGGDFLWQKPESCPADLALYLLAPGDARGAAKQLSCHQDIASDGCFSLGMLASYEAPLQRFGSWFYRRLFWECGMVGQVLYLEAEAAGLRGTGIGCFFDDGVHDLLGLEGQSYQSLYHFTVGHPVEDERLTTLPAYPDD